MNKEILQDVNELYDRLNNQITRVAGLGQHISGISTRVYLVPIIERLENILSMVDDLADSIEANCGEEEADD